MTAWGIKTWDANGIPNNYGLVPITVIGSIPVGTGQVTGGLYYDAPAGFVLDFIWTSTETIFNPSRRRVSVTGNSITISPAANGDYSAGAYPADGGWLIGFIRKQ